MKIKNILDTAATIAGIAFPPVGLAIKAVNAFLPDEDKLPETATGAEVKSKLENLPPEIQAQINAKYVELEIVESNNDASKFIAAMKADETGNTTRPQIADRMAWVITFASMGTVSAVFIALLKDDATLLGSLNDSWQLILAAISTPTAVVLHYFGKRTEDKKSRYAITAGYNPVQPAGILSKLFK
jgi:hypothetical protein